MIEGTLKGKRQVNLKWEFFSVEWICNPDMQTILSNSFSNSSYQLACLKLMEKSSLILLAKKLGRRLFTYPWISLPFPSFPWIFYCISHFLSGSLLSILTTWRQKPNPMARRVLTVVRERLRVIYLKYYRSWSEDKNFSIWQKLREGLGLKIVLKMNTWGTVSI